jgi:hypothetical protein
MQEALHTTLKGGTMERPTYEQLMERPELIEKCMRQAEQERAQAAGESYAELRNALSRALRAMALRFPQFGRTRTA